MSPELIEAIGWIGSMMFALCAAPQAYASYKQKHSDGLTWSFLFLWTGGEVLSLVYALTRSDIAPLIANYCLNMVFLGVILYYRAFPTRTAAPLPR